jgi:hypothetical protein
MDEEFNRWITISTKENKKHIERLWKHTKPFCLIIGECEYNEKSGREQ